MLRPTSAVVSTAALALVVPALGATAAGAPAAAPAGGGQVVASKLVSPLSLAVKSNGTAYVAQNFAGVLTKVRKGEKPVVVAKARKGREIGAVDVTRGVVTYAVSWGENEGGIVRQVRNGRARTIGNIAAAERATNPDGGTTYGFTDLPEGCEVPPFLQAYDGIVETHPYATAVDGGTVYVADAGANAVFRIAGGRVTPVAALPPVEVTVPAEAAAALELPDCVVGETVALEGVPTDVEVGPDGDLYVTSLPGGPEDGSLGANGSVLRIDPATGEVTTVATGFLSTTGVAVAGNGDVYVGELFTGRISRVPAGTSTPQPLRTQKMPAALELQGRWLWATTNVLGAEGAPPNGKVMRFPR